MSSNLSEGCREINSKETIDHLGGNGLAGALAYIGTRKIRHSDTELRLYVNGKPGRVYVVSITVNFGDLYDVEMWDVDGKRKQSLGRRTDIYFNELQAAVEDLYDTVMRETNEGFIPLT